MGTDQGAVESIPWKTFCFTGKEMRREEKYLVPETEYALYVNGMHYCQWMCSPWDLEDLAWGTLYGKGEIRSLGVNEKEQRVEVEMSGIMKDAKNNKTKETTEETAKETAKETAGETAERAADERWETHISPEQVIALSSALDQASRGFRRTGGVHMAALGDDGKLLLIREDVGRHNAMEKLMGACARQKVDPKGKCIVFSGRVAAEILEKAALLGASTVIAVSAPTSRACRLAEEKGILLIGFARGDSFNVYTFPERVIQKEREQGD